MALSARREADRLILVTDFKLSEIKTKDAVAVLSALGIENGAKALVVVPGEDKVSLKSLRNISGIKPVKPRGLNVYDILNAEYVVISGSALEEVQARLSV